MSEVEFIVTVGTLFLLVFGIGWTIGYEQGYWRARKGDRL